MHFRYIPRNIAQYYNVLNLNQINMKKIFSLILSIMAVLTLSAQTTTSSINGKVTDSNGEALVGANIIAVHTPSGTEYGTIANSDGRYNLQGMRTGGPSLQDYHLVRGF